jgi:hypothetical protein
VQTHVVQSENLRRQLEQAHTNVTECQVRERAYREKLADALEESRLMRAQLLEAQRQLSSGSAQTHHWRQAASESDFSNTTTISALQIANDEIAMLELDMDRVSNDNSALRDRNAYLEGIIYGNTAKRRAENARAPLHGQSQGSQSISFQGGGHSRRASATPTGANMSVSDLRTQNGPMSMKSATKKLFSGDANMSNSSGGVPSRGRSRQRQTAHSTVSFQSQQHGADMVKDPHLHGTYVLRPNGCSRSPTRCWAAATLLERENAAEHGNTGVGTFDGVGSQQNGSSSMLMF